MKAIVSLIVSAIFDWILDKYNNWRAKREAAAKEEADNKAKREALEKAKTKEELEDAAKDIAGRF